jgi:hypothetical protein
VESEIGGKRKEREIGKLLFKKFGRNNLGFPPVTVFVTVNLTPPLLS